MSTCMSVLEVSEPRTGFTWLNKSPDVPCQSTHMLWGPYLQLSPICIGSNLRKGLTLNHEHPRDRHSSV